MTFLSYSAWAAALLVAQPPRRINVVNAGVEPSTRELNRAHVGVASILAGLILIIMLRDFASIALAVGMVAGTGVKVARNVVAEKNRQRRSAAVANFLGILISELQAGAEISSAMSHAAEDVDDSMVAIALTTAARHVAAGRSGAIALESQASEIPELKDVAHTWAVSERYGMSQVALLSTVRDRLDQDIRHTQSTGASLQGAYVTAAILACLPLLGIGMGYAMGVNTLDFLFSGGIGGIILCVGMAFLCAGVLLSTAIITRASRGGDGS